MSASTEPERYVGRYAMYGAVATGGMASVHLGKLRGPVGFSKTVAIKRLHPHLSSDPEISLMFADEARLASRVTHPNVVQLFDVVSTEGELFLIMEYVHGETLSRLARASQDAHRPIEPAIVSGLLVGVLRGLHAAHEARGDQGEPLCLVHRDVSPQNILVGLDGVPRVLDFGVAKATGRLHETQGIALRGKVAYMAPEQLDGRPVDRRTDVWATSVVLWELLGGMRLFVGDTPEALVHTVLSAPIPLIGDVVPDLAPEIAAVVMRGLERAPEGRFPTALAMAEALELAITPASAGQIAAWVRRLAPTTLEARSAMLAAVEHGRSSTAERAPTPAGRTDEQPTVTAPLEPIEASSSLLKRGRRRNRIAPVIGAVATVAVAAAIMLSLRSSSPASKSPSVTSSASFLPETAAAAPSSLEVAPPPPATSSAAAPTSHAPGQPLPRTAKPVTRAIATALAPAPPATIAPVSDCDNAFVTGPDGIKHPKPQCFH